MKFTQELDDVVRSIDLLLQSYGVESVCGRGLAKARKDLIGWKRKGGPVPRDTVTRIVADVCKLLADEVVRRSRERK
jgi:hypothetical protein